MRRFQKDRQYVLQDFKETKQQQQVHIRVSTPTLSSHKFVVRSVPRRVQKSLNFTKSYGEKVSQELIYNIPIKEIANRIKNNDMSIGSSFYKEFLQLEKQSKNYKTYYDRKHNQKFKQLVLNDIPKDPSIIYIILRQKFPEIEDQNFNIRKLLALDINPKDDFDLISWYKYSLLRRLMTHKSVSITQAIQYLTKYFIPNNQHSIKKDQLLSLIFLTLRPFSNKFNKLSKQTLRQSIMKIVQKQNLLKGQQLTVKQLKQLLGKQSLFGCNDFLFLLFEN